MLVLHLLFQPNSKPATITARDAQKSPPTSSLPSQLDKNLSSVSSSTDSLLIRKAELSKYQQLQPTSNKQLSPSKSPWENSPSLTQSTSVGSLSLPPPLPSFPMEVKSHKTTTPDPTVKTSAAPFTNQTTPSMVSTSSLSPAEKESPSPPTSMTTSS